MVSTARLLSRKSAYHHAKRRHVADGVPVPYRGYKFNEVPAFAQERNEESDAAWDSLMPSKSAYVRKTHN